MALDTRIMKMVTDSHLAGDSYDKAHLMASVLDDLADLGLAKATKSELRRIVVRSVNRERLVE